MMATLFHWYLAEQIPNFKPRRQALWLLRGSYGLRRLLKGMGLYLYLLQAIAKMNDRDLKLPIFLGFLLFVAGLLDLLQLLKLFRRRSVRCWGVGALAIG
jgi:hypothetical protein